MCLHQVQGNQGGQPQPRRPLQDRKDWGSPQPQIGKRAHLLPTCQHDVFAWKPIDMSGVPQEKIEHSLNVSSTTKPIKQKLRRFTPDKKEAIWVEINRLLDVRFIKEVYHLDWLASPVLVRKKNKEWRMCVDYTDLNKHCPKDPFGLPWIDEVVDSTAGCELLSFLDCYSGYH